ncbi:hypothetical protein SS50377_21847 [Spironucleus salmonicida]|uniref:Uncharacterized protein n=1 Tax=Spironucleus salmonicida TaxID=348837 RepID=V6LKX5_9EUKA|nr:hypothetical protein SS50377_21847 [Spironucleus salmonicida]|eukprot:EST44391.1 Hypothetical protein SS50377_15694 [Spironucleus salmonicida]
MHRRRLSPSFQLTFDDISSLITANRNDEAAIFQHGTIEIYNKLQIDNINFENSTILGTPAAQCDGFHSHPTCGTIIFNDSNIIMLIEDVTENHIKIIFTLLKPTGLLRKINVLVGFSLTRKVAEVEQSGKMLAGQTFASSISAGVEDKIIKNEK